MLETLPDPASALAASRGDLLVRHLVTRWVAEPQSVRRGGAVAVWSNFWGTPDLAIVGPPTDVAALHRTLGVREVSVPESAMVLLAGMDSEPGTPWAFRWTGARPARAVPEDAARWLGPEDDAEVAALLDRGFPDASMRPGDPHLRRFAGIRDATGRLVACAGDATGDETLGFLASIASDPELRGQGLGIGISAWATDRLLREHGRVGLWHMGANTAADAVYTALGYRDEHRMVFLGAGDEHDHQG